VLKPSRRRSKQQVRAKPESATSVFQGGKFRPLGDKDSHRIVETAFDILEQIGIADTPEWLSSRLLANGASQRSDGRLLFPRSYVEAVLKRASDKVHLPGFDESRGITVGTGNVHIGTGGAAVQMLDASTGQYRESTLRDLHSMMRVLDQCQNVHYGIRPLVARDVPGALDMDINTAFACLQATSKPIGVSFDSATHVKQVVSLFNMALGGENRFRSQPFCFGVIVHMVSPLRYATSPASLAGSLAQGLAEAIAGALVVDAIKPGHPCIYAFLPFISDLRTGAMTGGSGESALTNAAAAQLLDMLGLPSTVSAGMTDSKCEDVQAGYEKGYSIALASHAGAGMINLSVGMLGSIMVASPESLLIDDDMCGAILRTVRGIEVGDDALDLENIERVVSGEGHYLGERQTLQLMKSEYVYPDLGDRQSVDDWVEAGREEIWQRAQDRVHKILEQPLATHLAIEKERIIRDNFNILL